MPTNPLSPDVDYGDNPLVQAPSWAQAGAWHLQNLRDTWQAMQDAETWKEAARQYGNAMLMGSIAPSAHGAGLEFRLNPDAPGFADRVSTRLTGTKAVPGDMHTTPDNLVGMDSFNAAEKNDYQQKTAANIAYHPGFERFKDNLGITTPDEIHNAFVDHIAGNLRALYDAVPDEWKPGAMLWYDGGNKLATDLSSNYGMQPRQGAAVYATLSPQTRWDENVEMGNRVTDIVKNHSDTPMTQAMRDLYAREYEGTSNGENWKDNWDRISKPTNDDGTPLTLNDITNRNDTGLWVRLYDEAHADHHNFRIVNPDGTLGDWALTKDKSGLDSFGWNNNTTIGNAVSVIRDGSLENISRALGDAHKVRNFYNNLVSPNAGSDVTIDTHAIAAANLLPWGSSRPEVSYGLGSGVNAAKFRTGLDDPYPTTPAAGVGNGSLGLYPVYAEAYRRVAADLGILPRQLQSVTWEGIRGLYDDADRRNPRLLGSTSDLWRAFENGQANAADTRAELLGRGIPAPDWTAGGGVAGTPWQRPYSGGD